MRTSPRLYLDDHGTISAQSHLSTGSQAIKMAKGGQVFISTHSPDFLNATELDKVFLLVKEGGYTDIKRASDDKQIAAYMAEGDQMGYLWKQGFFAGVDPS